MLLCVTVLPVAIEFRASVGKIYLLPDTEEDLVVLTVQLGKQSQLITFFFNAACVSSFYFLLSPHFSSPFQVMLKKKRERERSGGGSLK